MAEQTSSIAFEADISQFTNSIAEMRSDIKLINAQFDASSSALDDWSSSSEGLELKIKQLNGTLEAEKKKLKDLEGARNEYVTTLNKNKEKLAELKKQYETIAAAEGDSSANAKKLAKEIAQVETAVTKNTKSIKYYETEMNRQQATVNKTEKELNNYKDALKDVGKKSKETASNIKDASDSVGGFGNALKGIGKGLAGGIVAIGIAAAGTAASFLALAESTREAREDMARLTSAFSGAGLSANSAQNTFTDLYKVIGETDTAVEASQQIALLANSEKEAAKWAELATGVTATFGDALKPETFYEAANETLKLGEATGAFTQMLEGTGVNVDKFNEELASMNTEQEKQAYMLEVSEKAMGKAGKAYEETAGSIMEAREAEANLALQMQELGAIAEPITTILKNGLAKVLEELTPIIAEVAEGFEKLLSGDIEGGLSTLGDIFMSLRDKANEAFLGLLDGLSEVIPELLPKIAEFLSQAIQKVVEFAPMLLESAIQLFGALIEALPPTITKLIEEFPKILDSILTSLNEMIPALLDAAIEFLGSIIDALPMVIDSLAEALPQILTKITEFIQQNIPVLLEKFGELLNTLVEAIPDLIQKLADALPKVIGSIVDFITTNLPTLLNAAINLFNQIVAAIPVLITKLAVKLPTIISKIISTLYANAPKILAMAFDLFMNIVTAIPKMIIELGKKLPEIITTILNAFKDAPKILFTVGEDIIKGLWDGIKSLKDWLQKKLESAADWLPKWVKEKLGIASPSKVFKEIGKFSAEGLGVGFTNEMKKVKSSIVNAVDMDGIGIDGNVSVGVNGIRNQNNNMGRNVTLNYTVNSPSQLSRREIYVQAKKMQTLLGGVG